METATAPTHFARHQVMGANEAARLYGVSLVHFRRLYRAGKVPRPIKVGERKLGWMRGILLDDLDARAEKAAA